MADSFRKDIELEDEDDYQARQRYALTMDTERRVMKAKEREKEAEQMATAMVDGAGMWNYCTSFVPLTQPAPIPPGILPITRATDKTYVTLLR